MKIILSGVETNNKGAELMLYAILQELERSHPDSDVYVHKAMVKQGLPYIQTSVRLHFITETRFVRLCAKLKITGVLNRMGIVNGYLNNYCPVKGVDYFIDASGLLFSDQRINSPQVSVTWYHRLKYLHKKGVKIIFLPQAFGPLRNEWTIKTVKALDAFSDLIYARDTVSFDNLLQVVTNRHKLRRSTDFTSMVDGVIPSGYSHLAGKICIIPNIQMISKGILTKENYFAVLNAVIDACAESGYGCYFLNHEGAKDESLIEDFRAAYVNATEMVTGLNALQVKGLISTAYLVVSSRFHGVVSSLNSQVPCLSTSWNHKYAELYKDYGLESGVLPLDDINAMKAVIVNALKPENRKEVSSRLAVAKNAIRQQAVDMWSEIWKQV